MKRSLHANMREPTPRPKRVRSYETPLGGHLLEKATPPAHPAKDTRHAHAVLEASGHGRRGFPLGASSQNTPAAGLGVSNGHRSRVPVAARRSLKRLPPSLANGDSLVLTAAQALLESAGTKCEDLPSLEQKAEPPPATRSQPKRSWLSLGDAGALGCMARFVAVVQESRIQRHECQQAKSFRPPGQERRFHEQPGHHGGSRHSRLEVSAERTATPSEPTQRSWGPEVAAPPPKFPARCPDTSVLIPATSRLGPCGTVHPVIVPPFHPPDLALLQGWPHMAQLPAAHHQVGDEAAPLYSGLPQSPMPCATPTQQQLHTGALLACLDNLTNTLPKHMPSLAALLKDVTPQNEQSTDLSLLSSQSTLEVSRATLALLELNSSTSKTTNEGLQMDVTCLSGSGVQVAWRPDFCPSECSKDDLRGIKLFGRWVNGSGPGY